MVDTNKPCVAIIFDASFLIYDVTVPMSIIYTILNRNTEANIVYCGLPRLCMHVEDYAQALRIPKEQLIRIEMCTCTRDNKKKKKKEAEWFAQILTYNPDRIYCFRDNTHSNATGILCSKAIQKNIPIIEVDHHGNRRAVSKNSPSDISTIYHSKAGRIPYDV